jgi:hypothetical protein
MKELNLTEAQLRSWRPRRPAAGLKQKILTTAPAAPTAPWLGRCLAPAMACVWLTLMAFNHSGDGLNSKPMVAMVRSNQSYAAYASGASQTAQNHLAAVTFDWTNRSSFKSIIGFTPTTNFIN